MTSPFQSSVTARSAHIDLFAISGTMHLVEAFGIGAKQRWFGHRDGRRRGGCKVIVDGVDIVIRNVFFDDFCLGHGHPQSPLPHSHSRDRPKPNISGEVSFPDGGSQSESSAVSAATAVGALAALRAFRGLVAVFALDSIGLIMPGPKVAY